MIGNRRSGREAGAAQAWSGELGKDERGNEEGRLFDTSLPGWMKQRTRRSRWRMQWLLQQMSALGVIYAEVVCARGRINLSMT